MRAAARTNAASRSRCEAGLLEPLVVGERRHPRADRVVTTSSGSPQQRAAQLVDDGGVVVGVDAAVAGRQAPAHLGEHARAATGQLGQPVGALADREGLVQRGQALSAGFRERNGPR